MIKIVASRDEMRKVVTAALERQYAETTRKNARLFELLKLPFAGPLFAQETQSKALLAFLVEPYIDNLVGTLSDEAFINKVREALKEFVRDRIKGGGLGMLISEEQGEQFGRLMAVIVDNLLNYTLPFGYEEKGARYFAIELAREKNVPVEDIFASEELYKEFLRRVYTREEYQENIAKSFNLLNLGTLPDVFLKPMVQGAAENEEEAAEVYEEMKKKIQTPETQERMEDIKKAFSQLVEEEIARIYG